jgi:hypothetical protein
MKSTENQIIATIKKDIERYSRELEKAKKDQDDMMKIYHHGTLKGLELSLQTIQKAYKSQETKK